MERRRLGPRCGQPGAAAALRSALERPGHAPIAERTMSDKPVGVGIIGCGVISGAYLKAAPNFPILQVRACADLNPEAAQAKAAEFGIAAQSIEQLLADPEIEIVLNLTTPQAHVPVGLQA